MSGAHITRLAKTCVDNVEKISQCLVLLEQKRHTLEEKVIASYYNKLSITYTQIITQLQDFGQKKFVDEKKLELYLSILLSLNDKVEKSVGSMLKILRYDFNFLEQYFEYDYGYNLIYESRFVEDLESICQNLKTLSSNVSI